MDSAFDAPPFLIPNMPEGRPTTKPRHEDAAEFLIRMVHQYPHQITIYEGGPMTDLAIAISLDPNFASLTQGLVFMGGSIDPKTTDPEFATSPHHEFNLWFDPEAAHIVLRAAWPSITCTPVDVSLDTRLTKAMVNTISRARTPLARYLARYAHIGDYMWDELAAVARVDPSIITNERTLYMDVAINHGAAYGNTLVWTQKNRPEIDVRPVRIQFGVNVTRFDKDFANRENDPCKILAGP